MREIIYKTARVTLLEERKSPNIYGGFVYWVMEQYIDCSGKAVEYHLFLKL